MSKRSQHQERDDIDVPQIPLSEADAALFADLSRASEHIPSAAQAIVAKSEGIIGIGKKIELTQTGARFNALTEQEWKDFFRMVQQVHKSLQWIIADWAAYGADVLGWSYDAMAELTTYSRDSLKQYAYISRNVPASNRIDALSFRHHAEVARLVPSAQKEWLDKCVTNKWSVRVLIDHLSDRPALPDKDPFNLRTNKRRMSRVLRLYELSKGEGELNPDKVSQVIADVKALREWLNSVERELYAGVNG